MKDTEQAVKKAIAKRYYTERHKCPVCGKTTTGEKWHDKMSENENRISGLCQSCQDDIYPDWPKD